MFNKYVYRDEHVIERETIKSSESHCNYIVKSDLLYTTYYMELFKIIKN